MLLSIKREKNITSSISMQSYLRDITIDKKFSFPRKKKNIRKRASLYLHGFEILKHIDKSDRQILHRYALIKLRFNINKTRIDETYSLRKMLYEVYT